MSQRVIRFDSQFTPEAARGAHAALAEEGVRTDAADPAVSVSGAVEREDSTFTSDEIRQQAEARTRGAWQAKPEAVTREDSTNRDDGEHSFTSDEIRQRAQDATRNAWQNR
jgi:hypothetical protein